MNYFFLGHQVQQPLSWTRKQWKPDVYLLLTGCVHVSYIRFVTEPKKHPFGENKIISYKQVIRYCCLSSLSIFMFCSLFVKKIPTNFKTDILNNASTNALSNKEKVISLECVVSPPRRCQSYERYSFPVSVHSPCNERNSFPSPVNGTMLTNLSQNTALQNLSRYLNYDHSVWDSMNYFSYIPS